MIKQQEMQSTPLLSLRGIVKRFGSFTANDQISLDIHEGEAHALIGENGAGKSTLVKIIYGLLEPTEGEIAFRGRSMRLDSPQEARAQALFDDIRCVEPIWPSSEFTWAVALVKS